MDEIFDILTTHGIDVELHEEGTKSITLIASTLNSDILSDLINAGVRFVHANTEGRLTIEA